MCLLGFGEPHTVEPKPAVFGAEVRGAHRRGQRTRSELDTNEPEIGLDRPLPNRHLDAPVLRLDNTVWRGNDRIILA